MVLLIPIGKFPGHELARFMKNSSKIEHLVEKGYNILDIQRILGRDTDRFLENSSIFAHAQEMELMPWKLKLRKTTG